MLASPRPAFVSYPDLTTHPVDPFLLSPLPRFRSTEPPHAVYAVAQRPRLARFNVSDAIVVDPALTGSISSGSTACRAASRASVAARAAFPDPADLPASSAYNRRLSPSLRPPGSPAGERGDRELMIMSRSLRPHSGRRRPLPPPAPPPSFRRPRHPRRRSSIPGQPWVLHLVHQQERTTVSVNLGAKRNLSDSWQRGRPRTPCQRTYLWGWTLLSLIHTMHRCWHTLGPGQRSEEAQRSSSLDPIASQMLAFILQKLGVQEL